MFKIVAACFVQVCLNWMITKSHPPKLDDMVLARALLRLFATTFSRSPRATFSREPKIFALMFSVELERRLSLYPPLLDLMFSLELDRAMSRELIPRFSFELELIWLRDPGLELSLELLPPIFSFELDLRSISSIIGFALIASLIDLVISDWRFADVDRTEDLKVQSW